MNGRHCADQHGRDKLCSPEAFEDMPPQAKQLQRRGTPSCGICTESIHRLQQVPE